ncbi:MAG: M1 family metallopeptidase, partial [Terriglobales bacterium]
WHGAWNCHQFHETTEFFADFGTYDVNVTVPRNYVTGSSGDELGTTNNSDGTKTVRYHGEDIHDFAWTASPEFRVVEDNWQGSAGRVHIRLLMQPGHMVQAQRYMSALKGTLQRFDQWYGPYPYDRITVVDPAPGALESGGMEYPTFITADTLWRLPKGILLPEVVVEHEFGHQYWYGMVATNEFEEAWMDEGINTYTEFKIMDALYGPNSMLNFLGATGSDADSQHPGYARAVRNDPITRKGWQFLNGSSYGGMTYAKTGASLLTLESVIGEDTLRRALHTYFMRYRFTHPTGEDFFKTVNEVSGRDLSWFWNQAFYGTNVLDYEVLAARSEEADPDAKPADKSFRSTVVVHRKGDFIFPTEIEMRFADGERVREHWDGADRWIRYSYTKKARLVSAEVDPDHRVALDVDFFNNSRLVTPDNHATRKLADYWMVMVQFFSGLGAWLV